MALAQYDAAVFMVSLDEPSANRAFAESLGTTQTLLSDESGEVASAFGVSAMGGAYAQRWTFYIDREGVIRYIDKNVKVGTAGQDIVARLDALGFPKADVEPVEASAPPGVK
jgi:peroxiredoxin Q/BCP